MPSWKVTEFPAEVVHICSWNVNGLRAVMGKKELQGFLSKESPDILCLNETKISEEKLDAKITSELSKENYLQFWNCSKTSSGYAGTALFSKVRPIDVSFDLGVSKHDQEGRTITAEYSKFVLVACYVPNSGQRLARLSYRTKEWDADFRNYLKNLETTKNKCVILCGDLNVAHKEIDISNPKGNMKSAGFTVEEREEFGRLLEMGFADSFRELHGKEVKYSYWNMRSNARKENKGWRLDYFVTSKALLPAIKDSNIMDKVMGSDHCPVNLELVLGKIKSPKENTEAQEETKECALANVTIQDATKSKEDKKEDSIEKESAQTSEPASIDKPDS
eukprot:TRINITY_DN2404_c0_g1_i3.p1 TRINITY_DN2404_c0_g1~~TRINITY_DN2404_c0_g1_i3.p1  ORF type:complete len:334 (+),score=74.16 TRINITY_DN2404_c0_g1_i3:265-1266(+)